MSLPPSPARLEDLLAVAKAEADQVLEFFPNIEKDFLVKHIRENCVNAQAVIDQLTDGTIEAPRKHSPDRIQDISMELLDGETSMYFLEENLYNEEVKHTLEKSGTMFECSICSDEKPVAISIKCESMSAEENEHKFCIDCVKAYGEASVSEPNVVIGGEGLQCMHPGCKRILRHAAVISCIPKNQNQTRRLLEKRLTTAAMMASGIQFEECRFCSYAEIIEEPPEVNKVFNCVKCKAQFCRICKEIWRIHIGKKCREVADEKKAMTAEEKAQLKLEEELSKVSIRYCHFCKIAFDKVEGCNKMTCRCGRCQCYLCNVAVKNYDHFCEHPNRRLARVCDKNCGKCLLWLDPKAQEVEARNKLIDSYKGQISEDKLRLLY